MAEGVATTLLLGVLGAVFGSFIAVLAVRWPKGYSAMQGRSHCDRCNRMLAPLELVPILSYLVLRGRCRRCGSAIPVHHLVTEMLGAAIGLAAAWAAPGWALATAGALFGWLLLALAAIDRAAFWLPDRLTLPLALIGLVTGLAGIGEPLIGRIIGGLAGFLMLFAVARLYRAARGRVGLGAGDPKLFGAIGLWLGWRMLPQVLLIACAIGMAVVLAMRLRGRTVRGDDRLPFGTLLAAAAFPVWCWQAMAE